MPTYVFLNNDTGEIEEHVMSYKVLDEFKETNPHLKQQVTTANIVGGVATNFKVDDGFKEVLQKIGEQNPQSNFGREINSAKTGKQGQINKAVQKWKDKAAKDKKVYK